MSAAIRIAGLSYVYPDGTPALDNITLEIEAGACVALIGPNGAGKSTLLLHLNGLLPDAPPPAGKAAVFVGGAPVDAAGLTAARRAVGLLFQDPDDQLFCPTVSEDVAFGPRQMGLEGPALEARVRETLARVGLAGYERRAPHHLSRGEKRRVCLAGVLACQPRVLAFDEPTSDLDPRGRRELKSVLAALPVTRLIATHDLEMVVELCTRAIVLDRGAVIADGPPAELLSDEPLMLAHGLETPHILRHRHPHPAVRQG